MDVEINAGRVLVRVTDADDPERVFQLWKEVLESTPRESTSDGAAFGFLAERAHAPKKWANMGIGQPPGVTS